ncbi:MAG: hypothetical protein O7B81_05355, partial [Gammaproteobacteria bacterium]|nr:hypothetical protein [Gammaproteobacteria bacterium]
EINDGKVHLRAPRPLPDDLVDALRSRKAEIINLLTAEHANRIAARWGNLSSVVEWFLCSPPPAEQFKLRQGVTIRDPSRFWQSLRVDIAAGPGVRRDHYGAVKGDLLRIWQMFRPRAVPTTEQ